MITTVSSKKDFGPRLMHTTLSKTSHLHHHTVLCTDAIMSSKVKSECSMCVHILHARQIRNRVSTVLNQDLLSVYDKVHIF